MSLTQHLRMLAHDSQSLSKHALKVFSDIHPDSEAEFLAAWAEIAPAHRADLVRTLRDLAEETIDLDFRQVFLFCLSDPEPMIRTIAVDGLWEDERESTTHRLLDMLQDNSPEVRASVLVSLSRVAYRAEVGELSASTANAILRALLAHATDTTQTMEVRRRAIEGLGYFAHIPEARTCIAEAYDHTGEIMRESALVAMGRSMRTEWISNILAELTSPSAALRYEAVRALGEFGEEGQPWLAHMLPLLDDPDTEVVLSTIWAFGQIGGPAAQRILEQIAQSNDPARVDAAHDALNECVLDDVWE